MGGIDKISSCRFMCASCFLQVICFLSKLDTFLCIDSLEVERWCAVHNLSMIEILVVVDVLDQSVQVDVPLIGVHVMEVGPECVHQVVGFVVF